MAREKNYNEICDAICDRLTECGKRRWRGAVDEMKNEYVIISLRESVEAAAEAWNRERGSRVVAEFSSHVPSEIRREAENFAVEQWPHELPTDPAELQKEMAQRFADATPEFNPETPGSTARDCRDCIAWSISED